ncbi:MAG: DUF917 domain-containing protein [Pararhodobacter sp.]|nr:DUF917 domain-containing protein [Pararhodobacter sp.]
MRLLTRTDLADLAYGAALLGTGGGGSPWIGRLAAEAWLDQGGEIRMITPDELAPDALVVTVAMVGAPTIMTEKLFRGDEMTEALALLERLNGRPVAAILPVEVGGMNSTIPLVAAGKLGLPVVDADGMARAFPEVQMVSFGIAGVPAAPMVLVNEHGDHALLQSEDNPRVEAMARAICVALGGVVHAASYSMSGADVQAHAIPGTMSLAIALGAARRQARATGSDPFASVLAALAAGGVHGTSVVLARGRITDLDRSERDGFTLGRATITTAGHCEVVLEFRNENLLAKTGEQVLAIVPDLISVLDTETADPIPTEELRYGQRVTLLGIGAPSVFLTPRALGVVGPAGFGLELPHSPLSPLT